MCVEESSIVGFHNEGRFADSRNFLLTEDDVTWDTSNILMSHYFRIHTVRTRTAQLQFLQGITDTGLE